MIKNINTSYGTQIDTILHMDLNVEKFGYNIFYKEVNQFLKIELSKREVEVILELMELGITYEITHGNPEFVKLKVGDGININVHRKRRKIVNTNELKSKLRCYLGKV